MLGSQKKSGICLLGAGALDSGPLVSVRSGALGTVVGNCACGSRGGGALGERGFTGSEDASVVAHTV